MNLLNPLALAFALLAVPIILLYLLRLQRREQSISSTLLWRQVTLDREANTLWQKLRKNLLLFMQLLTLLFFVFALIRPYVNVPSTISGRVAVLIDASASMRATDVAPSRFEQARARASELIDQLGATDQMILILVDGAPRALSSLTSDKVALSEALAQAQPSLSAANWSAAIALAAATSANAADANTVVISDGANADDLKLIQGRARFVPIGSSGDNVAFANLTLRRSLRGLSAFMRISNLGAAEERILVSLKADGSLVDARTFSVPAGASTEFTINGLNPNSGALEARIDQAVNNRLAADDVAYAVNKTNATRKALLLTNGNRFLEQALSTLPGLRVTRAVSVPVDAPAYDLYVLDRLSMTLPARANVLIIGASPVFSTSGAFSDTQYVRTEAHPVTEQVDWRGVNVQLAQRVNAPSWLRPMVESQGGPLLYAGENNVDNNRQRMVLIPFELRRSDLPLQIAFPILVANSVDWLAPAQGINAPASVRPGDVVPLPENATVIQPDGTQVTTDRRGFNQTLQPGVYRFQTDQESGALNGAFAVNFLNPSESAIRPAGELAIGTQDSANAAVTRGMSQREFWNWLAALALLLLIAEWWVYQRGVPALRRR